MKLMEEFVVAKLKKGVATTLAAPAYTPSPDFAGWLRSNGWTMVTADGVHFDFVRESDLAKTSPGV